MSDYGFSSEIPADDPRQAIWAEQRKVRGFDDTEMWNLDVTIARFLVPRLEAFIPYALNEEVGKEAKKMLAAFKIIGSENYYSCRYDPDVLESGLDSFRENFSRLWN